MQQSSLPLLLTTLFVLAATAAAAGALLNAEDADSHAPRRQFHGGGHHRRAGGGSGGRGFHRHGGSWRVANHWCRRHHSAGLWRLPTAVGTSRREFDAAVERLAGRAASWTPPGCYWLGNAFDADDSRLHWLVQNRFTSAGRCLCVRGGGRHHGHLRLHRTSCHRRLPFHCQAASRTALVLRTTKTAAEGPAAAVTTTPTTTKTADHAASAATTTMSFDDAADYAAYDDDDDTDPDEAVEHAKFPEFELGPDGHPKGWLPPWHAVTSSSSSTAATKTETGTTKTSESVTTTPPEISAEETNETAEAVAEKFGGGGGPLQRLLATEQRSEFVTLLVLYSIVAVICLVLLGLCLVRCCRGYCGRAKVRYVRQVDADDIPRFMPSSWA